MDATLPKRKYPNEEWRVGWDFTNDLEPDSGDSVVAGSGTVTVWLGSTEKTSTMTDGAAVTSGNEVYRKIIGGESGKTYSVRVKATTTQGDVLERHWGLRVW